MGDVGHRVDHLYQLTRAATSGLRGPHPDPCVRRSPTAQHRVQGLSLDGTAPLMGGRTGHPAYEGLLGAVAGSRAPSGFVSITVWFCGTIGNVSSAMASQSPRPLFEVGVEPGVPSGWRRLTPRTLTFAGLVDVVISHVQLRLPVDTGHAYGPHVSSRRLLSVTVIVCA